MDEWNDLKDISARTIKKAKKLRNPKMRKMHIDQLYKNVVREIKRSLKKQ